MIYFLIGGVLLIFSSSRHFFNLFKQMQKNKKEYKMYEDYINGINEDDSSD